MKNYKILAYASALTGSLFLGVSGMTMQKMSEDIDPISRAKMYNDGTNLKELGLGAGYLVALSGILGAKRSKKRESLKSLDEIFE